MPDQTTPEHTPTGRERLWQALVRPSRRQIVVAVLLGLLGYAGVTQMRYNEVDDTYAGLRQQDLIDVLNGLAGTTQRAQAQIEELEETRDELRDESSARRAALEQAQEEAQTLRILAGAVPVTGPGIRITITEVEAPIELEAFIDMVQNLRNAGAEAIQVNGTARLVAQSWFEDGAGGILVDGSQLEPPYVVDVIGEPQALVGGVDFPGGPRQAFEEVGRVRIEELSSLDVTAVRGPEQQEFAQ